MVGKHTEEAEAEEPGLDQAALLGPHREQEASLSSPSSPAGFSRHCSLMERGSAAGNSEQLCLQGVERRRARAGFLGRRGANARPPPMAELPSPRASGAGGASTGRSNRRLRIAPLLLLTICVEMANSLDTRDGSRSLPSLPDNWHLPADVAQKRIVALIDK